MKCKFQLKLACNLLNLRYGVLFLKNYNSKNNNTKTRRATATPQPTAHRPARPLLCSLRLLRAFLLLLASSSTRHNEAQRGGDDAHHKRKRQHGQTDGPIFFKDPPAHQLEDAMKTGNHRVLTKKKRSCAFIFFSFFFHLER